MGNRLSDEQQSAFRHCAAMYKQLYSIYPKEDRYLRKQIEALIQLGEHDAAELLLDQLRALLLSKGKPDEAQAAEDIRRYLSERQTAEQYYATPFLHLASGKHLSRLFRKHKLVHCKEGEHLIRYGDTGREMYIVLSGELAFLDGTPRNADVLACRDSTLMEIPAAAVFKLFMDDPNIEATLRAEANIRKIMVDMKQNPALAKLPHHVQRILAKEARIVSYEPLHRIHQSGEHITHLDLITQGHVNFIGEHHDGSSLMLHVLKQGELMGCASVVPEMDHEYGADIVAMDAVTCVRLPCDSIRKTCELYPRLYQSLYRYAVQECSQIAQHLSQSRQQT